MIPLCYVQCNKKIERVRVVRVNAVMLMMMSWWYLNYGWPGVDGGSGRGRRPDQGNGSGHSPTLPWNYSFCNEVTGFVTLTMTMLFLAHRQGLESWQDTAFLGRPPSSSPPSPPRPSHCCQFIVTTSNRFELDHTSGTVLLSRGILSLKWVRFF